MPKNDKEYLEELGKNIRAKRKKLKMSQADLAYKVGMDVPNLSVIENGKSNPQILTLAKLAAAMAAHLVVTGSGRDHGGAAGAGARDRGRALAAPRP